MFFVYILYSISLDKYYTGHTDDFEDRFRRHNAGRSKATKSGVPWKAVYLEEFETRSEAVRRERQIKSAKSRATILRFINSSTNLLNRGGG